jgi:DNA processing protein
LALDERSAYLALALTPGIGSARLHSLLHHLGSALGALSAPFEFLRTVPGISAAAATAIGESCGRGVDPVLKQLEELGARYLLPGDAEFPAICRDIPDPPTLLFAQGNLSLLARPAVAIVGSRDHSPYGGRIARMLAAGVAARGIPVVSGMARGLDAAAHAAALDAGGPTVGVLGNGLGVIYPAANRALYQRVARHGLLLTEFPPGERPAQGSFPRRNRLISALARVTVVVEAAQGSGALITVGTALAQGNDVMAVPGPIDSPTSVGTNQLIRDGAEPLLAIEDLLAHYPEATALPPAAAALVQARAMLPGVPEGLSADEQRVFELLVPGHCQTDLLLAQAQLPLQAALAALSGLEIRGLVLQERGVVRLAPAARD